MKPFKVRAKIHSLDGAEADVTLLEKCRDNDFIVEYRGVKSYAIYNIFTNRYYVDDIYRRVEE